MDTHGSNLQDEVGRLKAECLRPEVQTTSLEGEVKDFRASLRSGATSDNIGPRRISPNPSFEQDRGDVSCPSSDLAATEKMLALSLKSISNTLQKMNEKCLDLERQRNLAIEAMKSVATSSQSTLDGLAQDKKLTVQQKYDALVAALEDVGSMGRALLKAADSQDESGGMEPPKVAEMVRPSTKAASNVRSFGKTAELPQLPSETSMRPKTAPAPRIASIQAKRTVPGLDVQDVFRNLPSSALQLPQPSTLRDERSWDPGFSISSSTQQSPRELEWATSSKWDHRFDPQESWIQPKSPLSPTIDGYLQMTTRQRPFPARAAPTKMPMADISKNKMDSVHTNRTAEAIRQQGAELIAQGNPARGTEQERAYMRELFAIGAEYLMPGKKRRRHDDEETERTVPSEDAGSERGDSDKDDKDAANAASAEKNAQVRGSDMDPRADIPQTHVHDGAQAGFGTRDKPGSKKRTLASISLEGKDGGKEQLAKRSKLEFGVWTDYFGNSASDEEDP